MERDDIIEYSLGAQHSEEDGRKIRNKIWVVTGWLSLITTIEVVVGVYFSQSNPDVSATSWELIKYGYIILTIIKARMIVLEFMHLGHERSSLKSTILIPYIFFILYLIFIAINEAVAVGEVNFPIN
jgi:cytochrome c oxidase subunit IV|tara:strand:+ start:2158 stop:2538 length:381 start_codon:yes stop_codon:yes gene_type:complete